MKIILPILTALITGTVLFFVYQKKIEDQQLQFQIQKLKIVEETVKQNIEGVSDRILMQLEALSKTIAEDKNFALRLLAENDRSSSDITEYAVRFMSPMGFSVLDITDSSLIILSSGHFAANAGNSVIEKAKLSSKPAYYDDNIMGQKRLTIQSKVKFTISDIPFYVIGGLEINEQFLKDLSPNQNVTILLKRGREYFGKSDIRSISEVTNGRIFINDKEYYAAEVQLPFAGNEDNPSLIIVLE